MEIERSQCIIGGCPGIYEATPEALQCLIGGCPSIYREGDEVYLIVGTKIDPKKVGLEGKVGEREALIAVPRKLIDERKQ